MSKKLEKYIYSELTILRRHGFCHGNLAFGTYYTIEQSSLGVS